VIEFEKLRKSTKTQVYILNINIHICIHIFKLLSDAAKATEIEQLKNKAESVTAEVQTDPTVEVNAESKNAETEMMKKMLQNQIEKLKEQIKKEQEEVKKEKGEKEQEKLKKEKILHNAKRKISKLTEDLKEAQKKIASKDTTAETVKVEPTTRPVATSKPTGEQVTQNWTLLTHIQAIVSRPSPRRQDRNKLKKMTQSMSNRARPSKQRNKKRNRPKIKLKHSRQNRPKQHQH